MAGGRAGCHAPSVNFFGHAVVASWTTRSPAFLLGAMVPDFCSIVRARLREVTHDELAAGVAHHHAIDAIFHDAPTFLDLCALGVSDLTALGVERGSARAVAHVGTELLLDGCLVLGDAPHEQYLEALAHARSERLGACLVFRRIEHAPRFHHLVGRLEDWGIPKDYGDPAFVADRVAGALRGRPRLRLSDEDEVRVREWMATAQRRVVARAPALLTEVRAGLGESAPGSSAG